jgi:hypothetical protein
MIERDGMRLPVSRQCDLLGVNSTAAYYVPVDGAQLALIDRQYLARPLYGSRRMTAWLRARPCRQSQAGADPMNGDPPAGVRFLVDRLQAHQLHQSLYPLSAARARERSGQPGCGRPTSPTHPDRPQLPLRRGDHGLGEPGGAVLAAVEHDGQRVLRGGARGGARALRQARDLQDRPRQRVHECGLHRHVHPRPACASRWTAAAGGMDDVFIRAAMALTQTRGRLPRAAPTAARARAGIGASAAPGAR